MLTIFLSQRKPKRKQTEAPQPAEIPNPVATNVPGTQSSQTPDHATAINAGHQIGEDPEFEALAANLAAAFEATQSQPNVSSVMTSASIPPTKPVKY